MDSTATTDAEKLLENVIGGKRWAPYNLQWPEAKARQAYIAKYGVEPEYAVKRWGSWYLGPVQEPEE